MFEASKRVRGASKSRRLIRVLYLVTLEMDIGRRIRSGTGHQLVIVMDENASVGQESLAYITGRSHSKRQSGWHLDDKPL